MKFYYASWKHNAGTLLVAALLFSANLSHGASSVSSVSVSPTQTGTLTYGTGGSVTYNVSLVITGSGAGSTSLSLNWTAPTGAGVSFVPGSPINLNGASSPLNVTLTISSSALTPAGSTGFTVTATSSPNVTSSVATFVVAQAPLSITANNQSKVYGSTQTTPIE
jgi:hypothetical protein